MKVKLLDVELIRRFGGVIVEMNKGMALSYRKQGKVKIIDELSEDEFLDNGTVLVFTDKEKKKEEKKTVESEFIFPQIKV